MIYNMSDEQKSKRKVIEVRGVTRMRNYDFLLELFEAFEQGYRPAPKECLHTADVAVFKNNRKTAVLYPEGYEVPLAGTTVGTEKTDADIVAESNAELIAEIEAEKEKVVDEQEDTTTNDDPDAVEDEDAKETSEEEEEEATTLSEDKVAEPTVEQRIETLTKKQELLDLAKELEVEVPADKSKNPAQIKKFLLESLKTVKE